MKKIVVLIIAMMMMPFMADAQIIKKDTPQIKTISSARKNAVCLMSSGTTYYLTIETTNPFDDCMFLKLGDTKDSAIQSLNDLIDILDTLQGEAMQGIANGYGENFFLWKYLGLLRITALNYDGSGSLAKSEINKFIKALQKE